MKRSANLIDFFCFADPQIKTKANAHLAHLQAPTHKPMLQLAKEPNSCQRSTE
jgi:hypothetical protein